MSEPFDAAAIAHQIAQGVAQLRECMAPIDEAVTGYRQQLQEAGWSPTAAEQMAVEFHRMLMIQVGRGTA